MDASAVFEEASAIDPLRDSKTWDDIVRRHEQASIFHTSAWFRVLHDTYGYKACCFVRDESHPTILALMEVDSWLTGRRGIALPFTDFCPALLGRDIEWGNVWPQILKWADARRWRYIELRDIPKELELSECSPSVSFYQHILELERDPAKVQERFESSTRRAIRKAEKSKITVRYDRSVKAIQQYYRLHCLTRQKHGLPPQPFRFFRNIQRHILEPGLGFVALASKGAAPIAGAVFFEYAQRAIYKFGASDPAADADRPSNAVMWGSIARLSQRAVEQLDFGRTSLHSEGLRRYKLGWGTTELKKHYLKWNVRGGAPVQENDNAHGFHNTIFRLCPKPLSRVMGRILYPHIA